MWINNIINEMIQALKEEMRKCIKDREWKWVAYKQYIRENRWNEKVESGSSEKRKGQYKKLNNKLRRITDRAGDDQIKREAIESSRSTEGSRKARSTKQLL